MSRVKAHPIILGQYPTTLLLSILIGDLNVVITGVVSVADSGRDSAKWLEGMQLQVIHCSCSICKVGHSIVTCWVHVAWRMRGLVGEFQSLSICLLVTTRQACVCVCIWIHYSATLTTFTQVNSYSYHWRVYNFRVYSVASLATGNILLRMPARSLAAAHFQSTMWPHRHRY